ncbi:MAG: hypothetical protein ACLQVF_36340, partial [Isosphaeraceae bacterium]
MEATNFQTVTEFGGTAIDIHPETRRSTHAKALAPPMPETVPPCRHVWLLRALGAALCVSHLIGPLSGRARAQATLSRPEMQVEDWIGHTKALPRVSTAGDKTTTVVFADDIEIGGSNYVFSKKNCPKNIIIIAETIRISDILNVDLSAGD